MDELVQGESGKTADATGKALCASGIRIQHQVASSGIKWHLLQLPFDR